MIPTPARIAEQVCRLAHVSRGDLIGKSRHPILVQTRRVVVGLCREMTFASFPEIARAMARRHWSTSHSQSKEWLAMDSKIKDGWRWRVRVALGLPKIDDGLSGELAERARKELA